MRAGLALILLFAACDRYPPRDTGPSRVLLPTLDLDGDGSPDEEDCGDRDRAVYPGATEYCNGIDDDCDGAVDEPSAADAPTWYADADGDEHGDPDEPTVACEQPAGCVADGSDCDDADPAIHPGAEEVMGDGVDQDCGPVTGTWPGEPAATLWVQVTYGDDMDGAGDMDGDGLPDIAIGLQDQNLVYVIAGSIRGECTPPDCAVTLAVEDHDARVTAVAGAGDVTGDGLDDLLVGSPYFQDGDGSVGAAFVVPGPITAGAVLAERGLAILGEELCGMAGYDVASAGDTDGDGLMDLLVGEPRPCTTEEEPGRAHLFLGPVLGPTRLGEADASYTGRYEEDLAGYTVAGAGDTDGDGYGDVLIGVPEDQEGDGGAGAAFLIRGPSAGQHPLAEADARVVGTGCYSLYHPYQDHAGIDVLGPGDTDGDGLDDIVIGSNSNGYEGSNVDYAAVFFGPMVGARMFHEPDRMIGSSDWGSFGTRFAAPGDMDGDGLADLMSPHWVDGTWLLYGPFALDDRAYVYTPDALFTMGNLRNEAAAGLGDVDGRGRPDVLVGDYYGTYLYLGEE